MNDDVCRLALKITELSARVRALEPAPPTPVPLGQDAPVLTSADVAALRERSRLVRLLRRKQASYAALMT